MTVILELGTKQHQYCPSVILRYSSNLKHSTIINVLRSVVFFLKSQIDGEKNLLVTTQKEWRPTLTSLFDQQQKYGLKQPKNTVFFVFLFCFFALPKGN